MREPRLDADRPDHGPHGLRRVGGREGVGIAVWEWGSYLGVEAREKGDNDWFTWPDGHSTGLYTWDLLDEIARCTKSS